MALKSLRQVVALAALAAIPLGLAGCSSSADGKGSVGAPAAKADNATVKPSAADQNAGGKKADDKSASGKKADDQGGAAAQLPAGGHGDAASFCKLFVKGDDLLVDVQKAGGSVSGEKAKQELSKVVNAAPADIAADVKVMAEAALAAVQHDPSAAAKLSSPEFQTAAKNYAAWMHANCAGH